MRYKNRFGFTLTVLLLLNNYVDTDTEVVYQVTLFDISIDDIFLLLNNCVDTNIDAERRYSTSASIIISSLLNDFAQ